MSSSTSVATTGYWHPQWQDTGTSTATESHDWVESTTTWDSDNIVYVSNIDYNDLNTEEMNLLLLKKERDYKSRWIMREGKRLNMKTPDYPFIPKQFFRRLMPCNKRGMGLRIRKREH